MAESARLAIAPGTEKVLNSVSTIVTPGWLTPKANCQVYHIRGASIDEWSVQTVQTLHISCQSELLDLSRSWLVTDRKKENNL